ncbi:hypothetical protein [Parvularcula sp. LCG005]|uniref:hypothetical protein n=1 Tax=Parvularcula sp. LCG005 TaxID=3078805 RepID=UPI002942D0A7|nr:hypothetical protein [Parvularcula sp. LCG005]WOI53241.1 hypothetical protein RUI03_13925 [Parvularcula sp. LCG005]
MIGYILFCILFLGACAGIYWYWFRKVSEDLAVGAQAELAHLRKADPALVSDLDDDAFARIYTRVNQPRFPLYALVTVAIFLVGTPIVLILMSAFSYYSLLWGWTPQPNEVALDLYLTADSTSLVRKASPEQLAYMVQDYAGFYYFFGLLIFWIAIAYLTMSQYHRRAPGSLREEVLRSR